MTDQWGWASGRGDFLPKAPRRRFTGLAAVILGVLVTLCSLPPVYFGAALSVWWSDSPLPPAAERASDYYANDFLPASARVATVIAVALLAAAIMLGIGGRGRSRAVLQGLCLVAMAAVPWIWLIVSWMVARHLQSGAGLD